MSTSADRLNDIWREWSLGHAHDVKKAQREALAKLETWLEDGSPEAVLRAAQALLVDPEIPAVGKRELFKPIWSQVEEEWLGAGTDEQDVSQLQAMLLAAWPRQARRGGFALLPMLASPRDVMQGRDDQQEQLDLWWQEAAWEEEVEED